MKKISFILFLVLIIIYLNRAYAHIYNMIKSGHLPYPPSSYTNVFGDSKSDKLITYVTLGDSLTAGTGADAPTESFPFLIANRLANDSGEKVKLINLAVPGARAIDVLNYQIPEIKQLRPDVVTILIGVNDIHNFTKISEFNEILSQIFEALKLTGAQINVLTIPYLGSSNLFWPPYPIYFKWQTERYNQALHEALKPYSFRIIDLYSQSLSNLKNEAAFYCRDQFHPSAEGYSAWANFIYANSNF